MILRDFFWLNEKKMYKGGGSSRAVPVQTDTGMGLQMNAVDMICIFCLFMMSNLKS